MKTVLSFWRKRAIRNIEESDDLLNIESKDMDYGLSTLMSDIPELSAIAKKGGVSYEL